ncbi:di-trans,poly-cis-decaprenylcistransferase, partial [Methylophaga sp. 42_8_T64]
QTIAKKVKAGEVDADAISEQMISDSLATAILPEPDLFIRTGGEQRVSNFLLWQMAYTEFFFTNTLWPDFDAMALDKAIGSFTQRERRFGQTSEQLQEQSDA